MEIFWGNHSLWPKNGFPSPLPRKPFWILPVATKSTCVPVGKTRIGERTFLFEKRKAFSRSPKENPLWILLVAAKSACVPVGKMRIGERTFLFGKRKALSRSPKENPLWVLLDVVQSACVPVKQAE